MNHIIGNTINSIGATIEQSAAWARIARNANSKMIWTAHAMIKEIGFAKNPETPGFELSTDLLGSIDGYNTYRGALKEIELNDANSVEIGQRFDNRYHQMAIFHAIHDYCEMRYEELVPTEKRNSLSLAASFQNMWNRSAPDAEGIRERNELLNTIGEGLGELTADEIELIQRGAQANTRRLQEIMTPRFPNIELVVTSFEPIADDLDLDSLIDMLDPETKESLVHNIARGFETRTKTLKSRILEGQENDVVSALTTLKLLKAAAVTTLTALKEPEAPTAPKSETPTGTGKKHAALA